MNNDNILSDIYKPQNPEMAQEIIEDILFCVSEVLEEFKKQDPDWFVITIQFNNIKNLQRKFFQL